MICISSSSSSVCLVFLASSGWRPREGVSVRGVDGATGQKLHVQERFEERGDGADGR